MTQTAMVEQLRARIRAIEAPPRRRRTASLAAGLDDALPWRGLPLGCLHEVMETAGDAASATAFLTALVARLPDSRAPVLWCRRAGSDRERGGLYAPGLRRLGLAPRRLLLAQAKDAAGVLWAMEEELRQPGLAAVVAEVAEAGFTASRRLQLAAEASGVTALLLRPRESTAATAAVIRWGVRSRPGAPPGTGLWSDGPRWEVELVHCRGGAPGRWTLEWRNATGDFTVAADVRDGPAGPQRTQMAG
ncbi:MAG: damage-inducible mutagenesis protein [Proteobacteria bacterium]|nr:damage-inducible mutagenesis protein [Pseudomonadota bacterium]